MALYLYCIRKTTNLNFSHRGIDGANKIFAVPFKDIEAVVSVLPKKEFEKETIFKKAQDDIEWIKEKAQRHETVIEEAMGLVRKQAVKIQTVIPMKFGTIFNNKKNLVESLAKHYGQFKKSLEKLQGKQEWNLKVYLADPKMFEKWARGKNKMIDAKEKEIASMNEGAAYFIEQEIEQIIAREKERMVEEFRENIFQALSQYAETGARGKLLGKELTGRSEPLLLNATFLVKEDTVDNCKKEIEKLAKIFRAGQFEWSGPWPLYHFI
jgi:hypothetical protein